MKLSLRELRGLGIVALGGQIKRVDENAFLVKSRSNPSAYHRVEWRGNGWVCDCADYAKRNKPCKHIYAVNFLLDL
ncbi:MAG: SWIM zinc finger family protein, partial [Candidatus Geothermarchaeota archaeon]